MLVAVVIPVVSMLVIWAATTVKVFGRPGRVTGLWHWVLVGLVTGMISTYLALCLIGLDEALPVSLTVAFSAMAVALLFGKKIEGNYDDLSARSLIVLGTCLTGAILAVLANGLLTDVENIVLVNIIAVLTVAKLVGRPPKP